MNTYRPCAADSPRSRAVPALVEVEPSPQVVSVSQITELTEEELSTEKADPMPAIASAQEHEAVAVEGTLEDDSDNDDNAEILQ